MSRPATTPVTTTTPAEILAVAVDIAGSTERLADFLCRPLAELQAWSRGMAIPAPAFLALVDIVCANALTADALDNLDAPGRKPKRAALCDLL